MTRGILVQGTIIITGAGADVTVRQADNINKQVIFKNCSPFSDCISEINNMWVDNAQNLDIVAPMYNLIKYSDNYPKTGTLWQYHKDESDDDITDSDSFKACVHYFLFFHQMIAI